MNDDTLEAVEAAIDYFESNGRHTKASLPGSLLGTDLIEAIEELPNRCNRSNCRKSCKIRQRSGGEVTMECRREHPHEFTIDSSEYTYYDLEFEEILENVADYIEETITELDDGLPRRITAYSESQLRITLVVAPASFEREVMEIYAEALRDDQPTLLLTTEDRLEDLLELASLFSTGSLVYSTPLSALSDTTDHLKTVVDTAREIQDLERDFIEERYEDSGPLINRVNSNPRYILTELNHMRLLRNTGRLSGGDRLETVAEMVFSHLFSTYPGEGGEDNSGQSVPDNLFYIPKLSAGDRSESVLGVVDAKSADEAKFGREEARGKHDEYLDRAERESVNADQIAHTFVILDFKGQQEIEFFDKMNEFYGEDTHLVIITADALTMLMSAYLAATVSNELDLIYGDFRAAIYPLFEPQTFRNTGLGQVEREVGQLPDEYRDEYLQRPGLLTVHRGTVEHLLKRCLKSNKEIDNIFEKYFTEKPMI